MTRAAAIAVLLLALGGCGEEYEERCEYGREITDSAGNVVAVVNWECWRELPSDSTGSLIKKTRP